MIRRPPRSTLFPSPPLFRSALSLRWRELAPDQPLNWVYQLRQPAAPAETRLMAGEVPDPHIVTEAGTRYRVQVLRGRSEEHTSELQSLRHLVCRLLLEKKKK